MYGEAIRVIILFLMGLIDGLLLEGIVLDGMNHATPPRGHPALVL